MEQLERDKWVRIFAEERRRAEEVNREINGDESYIVTLTRTVFRRKRLRWMGR